MEIKRIYERPIGDVFRVHRPLSLLIDGSTDGEIGDFEGSEELSNSHV